ncbi:MAG TPA: DUF2127 domain-containing protein [Ktedonobacteraceae bacterium]|nr:DUF2127 domain-containing protein [Ktedonobacteraceae bacterium]
MQMSSRRPLGVTIIAILVAIGAVIEIIGGLLLLATFAPVGIIALIVGIITLFVAWGLWTLKPWAFWLVVIVEVIHLIQAFFSVARGQGGSIVDIIFPIVIILYLFLDKNVRAAFRT